MNPCGELPLSASITRSECHLGKAATMDLTVPTGLTGLTPNIVRPEDCKHKRPALSASETLNTSSSCASLSRDSSSSHIDSQCFDLQAQQTAPPVWQSCSRLLGFWSQTLASSCRAQSSSSSMAVKKPSCRQPMVSSVVATAGLTTSRPSSI